MNVQFHEFFPQFSNNILQRIKEQTSSDAELSALKEMIDVGWPDYIHQIQTTLKPYWPFRDELATKDGIVMKAHRIIIPATLQTDYTPHTKEQRKPS